MDAPATPWTLVQIVGATNLPVLLSPTSGGVATVDGGPSTSSPLGPAITTHSPGELVITSAVTSSGVRVVGLHPGSAFTNDSSTLLNGWAHLTDSLAPPGTYQAEWDNNAAGTYCANAAAFLVGP